jgi:hypothetical protein
MSNNFIQIIPNALSKSDCDSIIEAIEYKLSGPKAKGIYYDNNSDRNDLSVFPNMFQSLEASNDLIADTIKTNKPLWWNGNKEHYMYLENIKLQKAQAGGGFTALHCEQGSSQMTAARFMVWMIYLNDVPKGGRTNFPLQEVSFKPTAGTLLYWPAAYTHMHQSTNDLESDKYIATGWFSYASGLKGPFIDKLQSE